MLLLSGALRHGVCRTQLRVVRLKGHQVQQSEIQYVRISTFGSCCGYASSDCLVKLSRDSARPQAAGLSWGARLKAMTYRTLPVWTMYESVLVLTSTMRDIWS